MNPEGAGWLAATLLGPAVATLVLDRRQLLRARRRRPAPGRPLPADAQVRLDSVLGHLGLVLSDPFTPLAPDHRRLLSAAEQDARVLAEQVAEPVAEQVADPAVRSPHPADCP